MEPPLELRLSLANHVDLEFPYMYHCHLLRHEDDGMMGQFLLVEPGTEDQVLKELSLKENSEEKTRSSTLMRYVAQLVAFRMEK